MRKNWLIFIEVVVVCVLNYGVEADSPLKQAKVLSNDVDEQQNKMFHKETKKDENELITNFNLLNWTLINENYEKFPPENSLSLFGNSVRKDGELLKIALEAAHYYLPMPSYVNNGACSKAVFSLVTSVNLGFTLGLVDSWGKFPDGINWGNYRPIGMYEECINLKSDTSAMKGRYCFIQMGVDNSMGDRNEIDPRTGFLFGIISLPDVFYSYGTCIPEQCTEEDMAVSLQNVSDNDGNGRFVRKVSCHSIDDTETLTGGDISMIVFLSIIVTLMFISTVADVYTERCNAHLRNGSLRFVLVFSLYTNVRKLFTLNTKPSKSSVNCLHGMRVLSMMWVVYGHQYIFTLYETSNLFDVKRKTSSFMYQIFANGTLSVDSFFFFSGFLVAYLTLQAMNKNNGRINLLMYYLHRYIRLTPAIAFTAWFQATLARFLVDGPYASRFDRTYENCRNKWWTDILYVNNYAVELGVQGKEDCVGQAWYTAVDTQIFIFTPILFIPLFNYRLWGKLWLAFWTLAACLVPAIITVCLNLPPFQLLNNDPETALLSWHYIYAAPFSRAGPYFVGIWAGYFIYKMGDTKLKIKYWQLALGWVISTGIALSDLFGMWHYNVLGGDTNWTTATQFFYGGFSRAVWAVPLSWIVIVCHNGYGGPVNWFLSHPVFQPLSRLTYAMFLTSLGMQYVVMSSNKQLFYFNHLNKLIEFCGIIFIIGVASTILTLIVESPMIQLEKEVFRRGRPQDRTVHEEELASKLENGENSKQESRTNGKLQSQTNRTKF